MALQERFNLENLHMLYHGEIEKAFLREVKRVTADCEDRPLEKKPRVVNLQFIFTPVPDMDGAQVNLDKVSTAIDISSTIPKHKTRVYEMKAKANGELAFHPDSPDDPDADMLYDEKKTGKKSA